MAEEAELGGGRGGRGRPMARPPRLGFYAVETFFFPPSNHFS
jgi:hypothetical protein